MEGLVEPFAALLDAVCAPSAVREVEAGASIGAMWRALEGSGFIDALVPEAHGGAGLTLAAVQPLMRAAGARALPLPLTETMVARALLADAGIAAPSGPMALVTGASGGVVSHGGVADHFIVDDGNVFWLAAREQLQIASTGFPGSLAARVAWSGEPAGTRFARPAHGLRPLAAVLRAALIAGAAERATAMSATYARERVQFGKPIGKQQALQQMLAVMAEDVVAARLAAELGCSRGLAVPIELGATAKAVASRAATRVAEGAHAVHGAIGVAAEHDLHLFTRRLHEWRMADGSESYWERLLGERRMSSTDPTVDWTRIAVFAED